MVSASRAGRMKIILNIFTAFVAVWGVAALAGFLIGMTGIIRGGVGEPLVMVGIFVFVLSVGVFAGISLYSALSFWKHCNKQGAERVLSLAAFYAWVTIMMTYPFEAGAPDFQGDPDRFPFETFLVLASVPVIFLIYRWFQERTRLYFRTAEAAMLTP